MKKFESIAIGIPEILLPKAGLDLTKWAVVACDQYTSQPDYWNEVETLVGDAPSTFKLIYPEIYLNEPDGESRIKSIREHMDRYLTEGLLEPHDCMVYVEREAAGRVRKGLVLCVDLEAYDFTKGSTSLIRATEGTIIERIPPRVKIRDGAALELPHIMVLFDDPENTVIAPLSDNKGCLQKLYDFKLMMNSGHLTGYAVSGEYEDGVVAALEALAEPGDFSARYGLAEGTPVLLFAMGDGNHSLATAKAIWEKTKEEASDKQAVLDDPRRFALVELVNLHDESLVFEPIHRVLFELAEDRDILTEMAGHYSGRYSFVEMASLEAMKSAVDTQQGTPQKIGYIHPDGFGIIEISNPDSNLPVGSLQIFLDPFVKGGGAREIDYVHGTAVVGKLGAEEGNCGFYLPAMDKYDLFKTVILDGALPRKTFSMGEAEEKRFYMECRKLG